MRKGVKRRGVRVRCPMDLNLEHRRFPRKRINENDLEFFSIYFYKHAEKSY